MAALAIGGSYCTAQCYLHEAHLCDSARFSTPNSVPRLNRARTDCAAEREEYETRLDSFRFCCLKNNMIVGCAKVTEDDG